MKKEIIPLFSNQSIVWTRRFFRYCQQSAAIFLRYRIFLSKGVLETESVVFICKILSWLYLHDKLDQKYLRKKEDETIEWLNERFIESFEKRFKRLPKETRKSIQNELTKIHFKLLHYTLNKSDEFPLDISFLIKTILHFIAIY